MEQITYEWIRSRRKTIAIQIKEGGKVVADSVLYIQKTGRRFPEREARLDR